MKKTFTLLLFISFLIPEVFGQELQCPNRSGGADVVATQTIFRFYYGAANDNTEANTQLGLINTIDVDGFIEPTGCNHPLTANYTSFIVAGPTNNNYFVRPSGNNGFPTPPCWTTTKRFEGTLTINNNLVCTYENGILTSAIFPVDFTEFNATAQKETIALEWSTATETNNSGFEVQRSIDGRVFETIAWVDGAGNSNTTEYYTFTDDKAIVNTTNFYRLKQIDYAGTFEYSAIVSATIKGAASNIQLYPNPVSNQLRVNLGGEATIETLQVFNLAGQSVAVAIQQTGNQEWIVDANNLPKGAYFVRCTTNTGEAINQRFQVVK